MADQHNTNIPAMANEISSDIPDIKENLEFHWDIFEQICLATSQTSAIGNLLKQQFLRSKFTYNGGTTAYTVKCEPAIYHCKDKYVSWDEELTTTAVGTPAADTRYYLYIVYDQVTSYTKLTDPPGVALAWSTTAPTWNDTYKQFMNGDDTCIFSVLANTGPTNIYEFFHDGGDLVVYADMLAAGAATVVDFDFTSQDIDTTSTDVFLPAPGFCTKALVTFQFDLNGATGLNTLRYFTKGQTGTVGHRVCSVIDYDNSSGGEDWDVNTCPVYCDADQTIQVVCDQTGAELTSVWCDGWYFPAGM